MHCTPHTATAQLTPRAPLSRSFGVVLYELYTLGEVPYAFFDEETTYKKVKTGYRLDRPDPCPAPIYDVMRRCWHESPEQRPTFTDVYDMLERIAPAQEAAGAPAAAAPPASSPRPADERTPAVYVAYGRAE